MKVKVFIRFPGREAPFRNNLSALGWYLSSSLPRGYHKVPLARCGLSRTHAATGCIYNHEAFYRLTHIMFRQRTSALLFFVFSALTVALSEIAWTITATVTLGTTACNVASTPTPLDTPVATPSPLASSSCPFMDTPCASLFMMFLTSDAVSGLQPGLILSGSINGLFPQIVTEASHLEEALRNKCPKHRSYWAPPLRPPTPAYSDGIWNFSNPSYDSDLRRYWDKIDENQAVLVERIAEHKRDVQGGVSSAIEIAIGHGNEYSIGAAHGHPDISRDVFTNDIGQATYKNTCYWLQANSSCHSGASVDLFQEDNGPGVCDRHAYDGDISVGTSQTDAYTYSDYLLQFTSSLTPLISAFGNGGADGNLPGFPPSTSGTWQDGPPKRYNDTGRGYTCP